MQMCNMVRVFAVALAVVNGWSAIAQSITWIGRPAESRYSIFVSFFAAGAGISEDGRTLVQASDVSYPYVWRAGQGWLLLGTSPQGFVDVSGDGDTFVGASFYTDASATYNVPAYYRGQWYPTSLPTGYISGFCLATSESGNVSVGSVGYFEPGIGSIERPFLWEHPTQSLTLLPIPSSSPRLVYAVGVSPEGSVAVGTAAFEDTLPTLALKWFGGSLTILPKLTSDGLAWAIDASKNGEIVVGGATNSGGQYRPVRWSGTVPAIEVLDTGAYPNGNAWCVSRTGAVITGAVFTDESGSAARWSYCGFEDLNIRYASLLTGAETLLTAHMLSRTGRYIAGIGTRNGQDFEVYILDTNRCWDPAGNVDTNCCVDDADLLSVLFDFGQQGSYLPTDLNCDGTVDDADLLIVLFNFGSGCSTGE